RQYAWEQLSATGDVPELRDRHLDWHLDFAERARAELLGPDQKEWLDRLDTEHDNLRAALQWSQTGVRDGSSALQLGVALWRFWYVRGYLSEGRRWLAAALDLGQDSYADSRDGHAQPPSLRARALYGAGVLARSQGDLARA